MYQLSSEAVLVHSRVYTLQPEHLARQGLISSQFNKASGRPQFHCVILCDSMERQEMLTTAFHRHSRRGLLSGDLPIDGVHERRTCCLGTSVTESQCPFAEAGLRVSVLAAAGEPSATPHMVPPYSLHGAVWAHGGDTCGPGADLTPSSQPTTLGTQSEGPTTQPGARTSLKKARLKETAVAEPCECHACASVPWPSPPLLPLPAPSPQQPLIHPHLYGSAPRGINLELESLDTLQQQAYLATLGDWDDSHYKLGPRHAGGLESPQPAPPGTGPPPGPPLRASSPPPVSVRRHSEQGDALFWFILRIVLLDTNQTGTFHGCGVLHIQ